MKRFVNICTLIMIWIMIMFFMTSTSYANGDDSICSLVGQMNEYYLKDYDKFWDILYKSEPLVDSCHDNVETFCFLQLIDEVVRNAEVGEYYDEFLFNNILFKNPDCFFSSVSMMNRKMQNVLLWHIGNTVSPEEEILINEIIIKLENAGKYKELTELYHMQKNTKYPLNKN